MPFVEMPLDDDYEDVPASEGEHDLRITQVLRKQPGDKEKAPEYTLLITVEDDDKAGAFRHPIWLPAPLCGYEVDAEQNKRRKRDLVRLFAVFNIAYDPREGFNDEDLQGGTGRCMLNKRERRDMPGEFENSLRLPKHQTGG
ncbi:MAG: hypothetical protein ACR2RF_25330 [Geminicoccaceae bacterium]